MASDEKLRDAKKKTKGAGDMRNKPSIPELLARLIKWSQPSRNKCPCGRLRGEMVSVNISADVFCLYRWGFFGNGFLSKSDLTFDTFGIPFHDRSKIKVTEKSAKKLTLDEKEARKLDLETIHNQRRDHYTRWRRQAELSKSTLSAKKPKMDCPYQIDEFSHLSLEEAFFLSFGLGCLKVEDDKGPLTICGLWNAFRGLKSRFLETYATYHYFRSMGWVVRDGMNYGADFMLYKEGMSFYHSSYAVIAYLVDDDQIGGTDPSHPWTWPYLTCMNRVAEHVAKEVLISLVIKPKGLTKEELTLPRCLEKFEVQEILLRRWIPEKHRECKKAN